MQKGPWGSFISWCVALGVPMTPLAGTGLGYGLIALAGIVSMWRGWTWVNQRNWSQPSIRWVVLVPTFLLVVMAGIWSYYGGPQINPTIGERATSFRDGNPHTETAQIVELFLQFSDEHTIPREIRQTNVRFWRALFTPNRSVKDGTGKELFSIPSQWFVFMLFEKPTSYRQMFANCSTKGLQCTVHESNNEFAIIMIAGDVSHTTLDISVSH